MDFLPYLIIIRTIRSISPVARSHRPKLPSIDNDDWGEGNDRTKGKSRSHNTSSAKRTNVAKRPPKWHKHSSKNYGSTNNNHKHDEKTKNNNFVRGRRRLSNDYGIDTTTKIRNVRKNHHYSEDSESESDDSCISSDFTR